MPVFHILMVAAIQGMTEFLPVSSSGHLVLLPYVIGTQDHGQVVEIAAHIGSLGAVLLYFRTDVSNLLYGLPEVLAGRTQNPQARLLINLAVATVPVVIAGFLLFVSGLSSALRSLPVVGCATLLFGLLLLIADKMSPLDRDADNWSFRQAVILGIWQAIALVPGTSRSGIVITGARFMGYERRSAARISMLMSIPTILAAGSLSILDSALRADTLVLATGAVVAVVSFLSALVALSLMMRFLRSWSFAPYVAYRIALGCAILAVAWA